VQTELVSVPEEGGSWAVDWLGARAGLLEGSVLPGQGISYIAAHNHLNNLEAGPFLFLLDLKENDRIFVRNGDELLTYTVYANELFEPDDFDLVEQKASEFENSVVLITCENESTDGGYLNRRVVFAKPL
ncbi:MAG: class F sortase, partial [Flexilinea flocculi]|nr:class F sortase [Flexilinea flocculi]